MIITIDGPIATGKSTIAKKLATAIGYIYFDTGAMYRSFTYALLKKNINLDNPQELAAFLADFPFDIKVKKGEKRYFVGEEDVTDAIRQDNVTSQVSRVSANPQVREKMVELQRELSKGVNAVFEGRDMGTVVFPNAQLKIFLTGRPEVRAKRRFDEMKAKYPEESKELTLEKCMADIKMRDEYDSSRDVSPLRKAPDACEIDTSDLNQDEIVYRILEFKDTRKLRATT
ncbi:MAG: (d)CMP kinase [Parachlamydiaceae bacterium]